MILTRLLSFCVLFVTLPAFGGTDHLPQNLTFIGTSKFNEIVAKAQKGNWANLPLPDRIVKFGRELHGIKYKGHTLEIHDKIESPSVNFVGLDCWTFFEISLGMARMVKTPKEKYTPTDLLEQIQWSRYRGGQCNGNYLDRLHYLVEWFYDNEARGTAINITRDLGAETKQITNRECREMTKLWKGYRYLRKNPALIPEMKKIEQRLSALPFYYIPKDKVAAIEPKLQNGDVIGIVTKYQGAFCSHVGMAIRTDDGVLRFFHASLDYRRVVIDSSLSKYLNRIKAHAGIIVARPQPVEKTVKDPDLYKKNLEELIARSK